MRIDVARITINLPAVLVASGAGVMRVELETYRKDCDEYRGLVGSSREARDWWGESVDGFDAWMTNYLLFA